MFAEFERTPRRGSDGRREPTLHRIEGETQRAVFLESGAPRISGADGSSERLKIIAAMNCQGHNLTWAVPKIPRVIVGC